MIAHLTGKIISKKPTQIILDVNGVGYRINISINTFDKIAEVGEQASLNTYLSVKEDSMTLFGFYSIAEKELFEILISVNGVGPKSAQGILSGINVGEFKDAVSNGNIGRLVAIPGIGRKTAERIIIELRDKVNKVSDSESTISAKSFSLRDDAMAALIGLGYNQKTADQITRKILESNPSVSLEDLIKESLKNLNN